MTYLNIFYHFPTFFNFYRAIHYQINKPPQLQSQRYPKTKLTMSSYMYPNPKYQQKDSKRNLKTLISLLKNPWIKSGFDSFATFSELTNWTSLSTLLIVISILILSWVNPTIRSEKTSSNFSPGFIGFSDVTSIKFFEKSLLSVDFKYKNLLLLRKTCLPIRSSR